MEQELRDLFPIMGLLGAYIAAMVWAYFDVKKHWDEDD